MSALLDEVKYEIGIVVDAGLQGQALIEAIADRLCRRIGGQTVYWPRADREQRARNVREDLAAGISPNEIARRHGISRKTVEIAKRHGIIARSAKLL